MGEGGSCCAGRAPQEVSRLEIQTWIKCRVCKVQGKVGVVRCRGRGVDLVDPIDAEACFGAGEQR